MQHLYLNIYIYMVQDMSLIKLRAVAKKETPLYLQVVYLVAAVIYLYIYMWWLGYMGHLSIAFAFYWTFERSRTKTTQSFLYYILICPKTNEN